MLLSKEKEIRNKVIKVKKTRVDEHFNEFTLKTNECLLIYIISLNNNFFNFIMSKPNAHKRRVAFKFIN